MFVNHSKMQMMFVQLGQTIIEKREPIATVVVTRVCYPTTSKPCNELQLAGSRSATRILLQDLSIKIRF